MRASSSVSYQPKAATNISEALKFKTSSASQPPHGISSTRLPDQNFPQIKAVTSLVPTSDAYEPLRAGNAGP